MGLCAGGGGRRRCRVSHRVEHARPATPDWNLHRVKHHLRYDTGGVWNGAVPREAVEAASAAVAVTGLAGSYGATVGELLGLSFTFEPSTAVPSVSSVTPAGLVLALFHSSGAATVEGTPTLAGAYEVTFAFTQGQRTDTRTTTVNVACAAGHTQQSDRSCEAPEATVHGLALSYDATVGELFSVGFTYEPEAAVLSVASVTPSGLAFTRRDTGNAVGLAGTPSLAGDYTVDLELRQPGRVDTHEFTIAAECREGHTELPDRSCEAPVCAASLGRGPDRSCEAPVCAVSLGRGWVSSGTLEGSGSWESGCVLPAGRRLGSGAFYAKHFRFSLLFDAVVTIDLTSSDEDAYLFLLEGYGAHGDEVDHDNDGGTGRNSKLSDLSLDAGAYTVAASTYHSERTGSFEVSLGAVVPLTVTDLDSHYSVTVGDAFSANFTYKPATARLGVSWYTRGMNLMLEDSAGDVDIAADTLTSAGTYRVILAFAQPGHTDYKLITIIAACPAGHAESLTGDGSCVPVATVPAGCAVTALGAGQTWWGRVYYEGPYFDYGASAPSTCSSLSQSGARAKYWQFTVPASRQPDGLSARVGLEIEKLTIFPVPLLPEANSGYPSLTLWKYVLSGGHPTMVRGRVQRVASDTSRPGAWHPSLDVSLTAGTYVVEVAPTRSHVGLGRFGLAVVLPTAEEVHADVRKVGNTGLNGNGMNLHQFLEARGSLSPSSGGGNFDPPSADYPWLPFTSDGCSIPLLLTSDRIADLAEFGGVSVPFIYGCFRHDFNWRNLHRVKHHLRHDIGGVWNGAVFREANGRLGEDLLVLCRANQPGSSQASVHYTWTLPRDLVASCEDAVMGIKFGVGLVPFPFIGYTH